METAPRSQKLKVHLRHIEYAVRTKDRAPSLVRHSGLFTPLKATDLVAMCVVRDANSYIRSFLRYYRKLGVTRFVFVDDRSEDGTRELLERSPDVDLFTSSIGYAEAKRGRVWRDAIIELYGRNRWYLSVDADEFLVFPGSEERSIPQFIADLERGGFNRCFAPMLDLYPAGPLSSGAFTDDGSSWPFETSSSFDGDGYWVTRERYGNAVRGGPRTRLFGLDMRLSKFPLIWADKATDYRRGSIHGPGPCIRNFIPIAAVLLHYRFSASSVHEFRKIVEVGGHIEGGSHYKAILNSPQFSESFSLAYEGSLTFIGSEDLVRRGFMMDLRN